MRLGAIRDSCPLVIQLPSLRAPTNKATRSQASAGKREVSLEVPSNSRTRELCFLDGATSSWFTGWGCSGPRFVLWVGTGRFECGGGATAIVSR